MKNGKVKKAAVISFVIIAVTMIGVVGVAAMVSNKSPRSMILDLFQQRQSDNPSVLDDVKNTDAFASVNGIPIQKNVIFLKKALYEAVEAYSQNGGGSLPGELAMDSYPSEEEIVQDIAKRLLFVEYAKEKGIVVEESEVVSYLNESKERHEQLLQENNPEAILKEQFDKEFLEHIGLSEEEFKEYIFKEEIVYVLCCEKFARSMSDTEASNWKGFDSFCNDLLAKAEIIYY